MKKLQHIWLNNILRFVFVLTYFILRKSVPNVSKGANTFSSKKCGLENTKRTSMTNCGRFVVFANITFQIRGLNWEKKNTKPWASRPWTSGSRPLGCESWQCRSCCGALNRGGYLSCVLTEMFLFHLGAPASFCLQANRRAIKNSFCHSFQ